MTAPDFPGPDRVVVVVRTPDEDSAARIVRGAVAGGLRTVEVTFTTPGATRLISLAAALPGVLVGAGTVRSAEQVEAAVGAGARFVVSPGLVPEVIVAARDRGVLAVPGALTPTEVQAAAAAGGGWVKLFPAGALGPRYLRDLASVYPDVRLVPTGGVTAANLVDWLAAGAAAVGVGSEFTRVLDGSGPDGVRRLAEQLREARAGSIGRDEEEQG